MVFESLFPTKRKKGKETSSTITTNAKYPSNSTRRSKKRKRNSSNSSTSTSTTCTDGAFGVLENDGSAKSKEEEQTRRAQQQSPPASTMQNDKFKKLVQKDRRKFTQPSQDALELSSRLKEFTTQKNLSAALELYHSPTSQPILDEHHLCIIVDCCGRCGNIDLGEKLVNEWVQQKGKENHHQKKRRRHVNVHTKTALMKGYAHSGRIDKAEKIYLDMQTHQGQGGNYQGPNVRTLNTLLRGCLWAAVSLEEKGGGNQINGGVVTADIVWPKGTSSKTIVPDTSSYEYYISLLSQALRCQDAQKVLDEFMRAFHVKVINQDDSDHCRYQGDASVLETLGNSLFQLARAHAILGNHTEAKSCARKVLDVIASTKEKCLDTSTTIQKRNKFQTTGGKRGKKELHMDGSRRELSNTLFRNHKMDELEMNAKDVLDKSSCMTCDPFALAQQFSTKVLYFAGGGTTDLSVLQTYTNDIRDEETMALDSRKQRKQLLNALWFSFGLSQVMNKAFPDESFCSEKLHHGRPMPLTKKECSKILKALNLTESYVICEDGTIDFSAIFKGNHNQATSSKKRELNIELGSGFGEWAVHQAQSNPFHDYVAVELRSDRVSLTFSKAYLQSGQGRYPLNNLCCVGAECGSFLGMRVKPNTVSRIFVNHPEPPTQTIGANNSLLKRISDGGEEPAHMLNSATLVKAARCLDSEKGQMVIVTDNRWYANLICATFLKVMKQERGIFFSTPLDGTSAIRPIDVFYADSNLLSITLYEGQPNEFIGHSTACVASQSSGSTYFDRLWRKGAGSHADVKKRFIICVSRHEKSRPQHVNSSKKAKQKLNKRNGKL